MREYTRVPALEHIIYRYANMAVSRGIHPRGFYLLLYGVRGVYTLLLLWLQNIGIRLR